MVIDEENKEEDSEQEYKKNKIQSPKITKKQGGKNFQNRVVDSEEEYPNNFNTNR